MGERQERVIVDTRINLGPDFLQHGVIPGSSHPMALGISSPGLDEVDLM
jgi:hypothetical protein